MMQRRGLLDRGRLRLCLFLVLSAECGISQEYRGTIAGQVLDQTGAAIPRATVEAIGPTRTYRTTTAADGVYTLPFVDLGTYRVEAQSPGFGKTTQSDVRIDVVAHVNVNFTLRVAGAADSVTVVSNKSALDTTDASVGTVMDPEMIHHLPLNGGQVYTMLSLTPGVRFTTTQFGPGGDSGTRGWDETNAYSINGQSGNYNQFGLNGAPVSQQGGGGAGTWNVAPSIDAVDEFKVMTNTYSAQYGREAGGTVNTVLRSGTDHIHGTLFDNWRNSIFDANTYQLNQVGVRKPFHNQHQFGGTFGGPILRHKAYLFVSFEGWREVLPVGIITGTVTPDMLPGPNGDVNLSNYLAATTGKNIYDPLTEHCIYGGSAPCAYNYRDQFPNNTIPANRISPVGLAILKLWPKPNIPGNGYSNNYVSTDPGIYKYNQPLARVDYDFTDKTRMYLILSWWSGKEYRNSSGMPGELAQGNIENYRSTVTQVVDATHTFTQSLVGDVRLSFNRPWNVSPNGAAAAGLYPGFTAESLGLSMPQIPTATHDLPPQINVYNCCTSNIIGNTTSPTLYETYELSPTITHTVGEHNLHYGGQIMFFHDVPNGVGSPNGQFTFSTQFTQQYSYANVGDGDAIAALLLGYPDNGSVDYFETAYESYHYYAAYVQDDWKVSHRLALNLGVRWERESSPRDRNNRITAGFCTTCINPISSLVNSSGAATGLPATILGGLQFSDNNFSAYKNYWGTLLPKIGVSYSINDKLVVRGGWGLSTALGVELGALSPWQTTTNYITSLDGSVPTNYFNSGAPYPNGVETPPGSSGGLMSDVGNSILFDRRDREIPRTQSYSFGFQGAAPFQSVWDVEFVGKHTSRLRSGIQLNALTPAQFAAGAADPAAYEQIVANPFYGIVPSTSILGCCTGLPAKFLLLPFPEFYSVYDYADPQGYTNYNSLQAKYQKEFTNTNALTKGLAVLASFTRSKTMTAVNRLNNTQKFVDPEPAYTIDSGDRSWDFSFAGVYNIPIGHGGLVGTGAHGVVGQLVNDWQLGWIYQNNGGLPVSYPNGYVYNCGTYNIRTAHRTYKSWINNSDNINAYNTGNPTTCFTPNPEYTLVTQKAMTTAIRAPWAQQTSVELGKQFKITEADALEFDIEGFNVTNTPIFGGPNTGGVTNPVTRNSYVTDPNAPGAWSGYGTIGSTQMNFPRQLQISLKVLF